MMVVVKLMQIMAVTLTMDDDSYRDDTNAACDDDDVMIMVAKLMQMIL